MPQPNSSTAARWQPTCKCAGRPRTSWLPQIPGLTPGEGGSPTYTMHNHTMFLTCLYPSVSALNHAPQPYGPVPGREGGARIARHQTPHPTPDRYRHGVGAFNTNLNNDLTFFNELCIHECMTGLQAPGLQFACFYFRQRFNRSNCKYIHF